MKRIVVILWAVGCAASGAAVTSTLPAEHDDTTTPLPEAQPIVDALVAETAPIATAIPSATLDEIDGGCLVKVLGQSGPGVSAACKTDDECALVTASCCTPCGALEASELHAISRSASEQHNPYCPVRAGCPRCMAQFPYAVDAACRAGRCVVVRNECTVGIADAGTCIRLRPPFPHLPELDDSACTTHADCEVAARCCTCGRVDPRRLVGGNHRGVATFRNECQKQTCDACAPLIPPGFVPECVGGRCRVHDLGC